MREDRAWFAPKRFGFGAGYPISWQGWILTGAFAAIIGAAIYFFGDEERIALGMIIPAAVLFTIVAARTTRGGWHWRWNGRRRD